MESMTTKEFYTWLAYYKERPFGEVRADYRMALNTQTLISPYMKETRPLQDFVLSFGSSLPTSEELRLKIEGIAGSLKRGE